MNAIWKIISMVSFGLLVYQVFFQENENPATDFQPGKFKPTEMVCTNAEEMPRFPGCEYSSFSKEERHHCANKKLLEFVYSNLKYPHSDGSIEGTAVVQFIVEKDGSLTEIRILKSLTPGFDEEIVRVLKKMPNWIPGMQSGKEIRVRFKLPVKIRLE